MGQCPICKNPTVDLQPGSMLYAELCIDCRKRVLGTLKNKAPQALEKIEKKITRKNW